MEVIVYVTIGVLVGIAGAMLGIGGGIVIVPLLSFVFGVSPQEAVGTSMVVVMFNSLSGAFGYLRRKMVYLKAAVIFAAATIPGALCGGYVAHILQGRILYIIFGIFFCCFAVSMYVKASGTRAVDERTALPEHSNLRLGTICSVGVGFLASILGIGGGIIHVPMMTYLLKFPYRTAVATSTFILSISAIAGAASHAFLGHVQWTTALCLGAGAIIGAQMGVRFLSKTRSAVLLKITAVIVLLMGVKFIFSAVQP